MSIWLFS
jgi:hypothetical protein